MTNEAPQRIRCRRKKGNKNWHSLGPSEHEMVGRSTIYSNNCCRYPDSRVLEHISSIKEFSFNRMMMTKPV